MLVLDQQTITLDVFCFQAFLVVGLHAPWLEDPGHTVAILSELHMSCDTVRLSRSLHIDCDEGVSQSQIIICERVG